MHQMDLWVLVPRGQGQGENEISSHCRRANPTTLLALLGVDNSDRVQSTVHGSGPATVGGWRVGPLTDSAPYGALNSATDGKGVDVFRRNGPPPVGP